MRVLFTTIARTPHLYPTIPLGWACRAAGHEVRVASAPPLAGDIIQTGLPAITVGRDVDLVAATGKETLAALHGQGRWPADWPINPLALDPEQRALLDRQRRNMAISAAAMVDDLVAFARDWQPDLVVHEASTLAGAVAAAVLGVPGVSHRTGSACPPKPEIGGPRQDYAELFERFEVEPLETPALSVEPCPPSMRLAVADPGRRMRYVPYNGPGLGPRWLGGPRARPRVCITWGHTLVRSIGVQDAALDPFRESVQAIADLGVEVLVATTAEQLDLLGELPAGALTAESVPLHLLLPHCDAIVHQAGVGTTMTAATLGIPQLAITQGAEPEVNGRRLVATSAGLHLRYQELKHDPAGRDLIRAAGEKLLGDPGHRQAAQRLRDEIARQPAPAEVVAELERLARPARTATTPAAKRIPIFAVHVSERAVERAVTILRSGYIGDGPVVREFEAKVARFTRAGHTVAVNSATSALSLALALVGAGPGDEVITTAQTFIATSQVILAAGARPVFADVQYGTGNLDPADIAHRITPRTKAILPVHWAGYPCDLDEILAIADRHGLPVIEDAAQALGASYHGRPIGSLSPIACFSFQAIKQLTTVDGGMLCLRDQDLAEAARRRRWFGIDRTRRQPTPLGEPAWDVAEVGYKYHMNDVAAALGTAHMDEFPAVHARLAAINSRYREALSGVGGLKLFDAAPDREGAYFTFCVHVERREDFAKAMRGRGVEASVVHLRIDGNSIFGPRRADLPQLDSLTGTMICLPLHYRLDDEEVENVVQAVRTGW